MQSHVPSIEGVPHPDPLMDGRRFTYTQKCARPLIRGAPKGDEGDGP